MRVFKRLLHTEGLNLNGRIVSREAVRGIIYENNRMLMIYSPQNRDYKFPGGGINSAETHADALIREVMEEGGVRLLEICAEFGVVVEYDKAIEENSEVFMQSSFYYICKVCPEFIGQRLDEYEKELKFRPEWVDINVALSNNRSVLNGDFGEPPRWVIRETYVLGQLAEMLSNDEFFKQ